MTARHGAGPPNAGNGTARGGEAAGGEGQGNFDSDNGQYTDEQVEKQGPFRCYTVDAAFMVEVWP